MAFVLATGVFQVGCGRSGDESKSPPPPPAAPEKTAAQTVQAGVTQALHTVSSVVTQAQHVAQSAVAEAKEIAKAAEEKAHQVQQVAVQATEKAQSMLDQAKALLAEKKTQEAAVLLDKLAGVTLSADQQHLLTGLKTELKSLTAEIEKGLGDLKTCVAEKNYNAAGTLVTKLASYQMSPEQQKVFDGLKEEWSKLAKSQAVEQGTKAINNLLGR